MISTQRLILIILFMNIAIGIAGSIYQNPTFYEEDYFYEDNTLYENYGTNFKDSDTHSGIVNREQQYEVSIGNSIEWGEITLNILWNGLNPFSFTANDFNSDIEKVFANVLILFRSLMYIIIIIEVYMFFKNKKNT